MSGIKLDYVPNSLFCSPASAAERGHALTQPTGEYAYTEEKFTLEKKNNDMRPRKNINVGFGVQTTLCERGLAEGCGARALPWRRGAIDLRPKPARCAATRRRPKLWITRHHATDLKLTLSADPTILVVASKA
ncbi:hypothetical protein EVAR_54247_1 [Eumeta japonica]|uniref:Uncharacterized protein n=1 Tax=Eumeta variegata TaxID=151549 RepID=A0A4C1YKQ4_EUMVA|nr:hypothetical protein EVAR_54247_1 [Eumeta japonica]